MLFIPQNCASALFATRSLLQAGLTGGVFDDSSKTADGEGTRLESWIHIFYESGRDPGGPFHTGYLARFNLDWSSGGRHWAGFSARRRSHSL
jgi:hypothetical protein